MRTLTIGTCMMRHPTLAPDETLPDSNEPRLEEAAGLLAEAAGRGCDICCLPELFADPSQGTRMADWAEAPGGPVTTWLARQASDRRMAVVASVALRDGDRVANTGVIYGKDGRLTGAYAKVHLPEGERDMGAPGDAFPVWRVEGVAVGMQICYDLGFPEGCRILAVKGAQIVFWPNMWGGMPEARTDVLMRARAIENSVVLVSSAFLLPGREDFRSPKIHGRSCVIDPNGAILAEVGQRLGVAVATVAIPDPATAGQALAGRRPDVYGELGANA